MYGTVTYIHGVQHKYRCSFCRNTFTNIASCTTHKTHVSDICVRQHDLQNDKRQRCIKWPKAKILFWTKENWWRFEIIRCRIDWRTRITEFIQFVTINFWKKRCAATKPFDTTPACLFKKLIESNYCNKLVQNQSRRCVPFLSFRLISHWYHRILIIIHATYKDTISK